MNYFSRLLWCCSQHPLRTYQMNSNQIYPRRFEVVRAFVTDMFQKAWRGRERVHVLPRVGARVMVRVGGLGLGLSRSMPFRDPKKKNTNNHKQSGVYFVLYLE